MKRFTLVAFVFLFLSLDGLQAQHTIDLAGRWQFDRGQGSDYIQLPGSMPQQLKGDDVTVQTQWTGSLYDSSYYYNPYMEKYRREGNVKFPFFLTPDKHYVGVAWYKRSVQVPASWRGERILLFLERPHIETTVWINNKQVGSYNSLCVPHVYDVTDFVRVGANDLSIRVDNRIKEINVGPDSHSITDQTQGNWNGIVGRIELQMTPRTYIEDVQAYPSLANKNVVVKLHIKGVGSEKAVITLDASAFNTPMVHQVAPVTREVRLKKGMAVVEVDLPMGDFLSWDEFHPALYRLKTTLTCGKKKHVKETTFGMREFKIEGKWFYVNGRKTMLRGTVENCDFPLTGYAPMEVSDWERVFRICRSYGLNHMRFHSYCPPEAAFIAADLVGFYLQPEGPSWPNHGPKLGLGQPIDTYLMEETVRLTKEYGNYASFCMLACGNEPSGRWVDWVSKFVDYWRTTDSRRVYTGASVGGSWQWQPKNQYHVKAGARGLAWRSALPESRSDFRQQSRIDTVSQPYVSHETGQWCAFPNFNEIRKYTGVNKAKNFEIFRDLLADNQMAEQSHLFMMASGKLQALCYKHEIEKTLRTPDYAGFQLLALNDYSGQGTALVGVLDVFFEEKGYIDAVQWRRFCSPTVPLMRTDKFVYTNDELLLADLEVSHFGATPLKKTITTYTLKDEFGKLYAKGSFGEQDIPIGNLTSLGQIRLSLAAIDRPKKLNLEVRISGTEAVNDWDFWVYPTQIQINNGTVYVCDSLDAKAQSVLQEGGDVLITAAGKISYGQDVKQYFTPVFWNTSWFKMRPPHTTGILVNPHHPLFRNFPTDYHSNLQWWELLNGSQVMQFTDFPADFQPTVQSIDTWFICRKIGTLFEANVGKGRVLMTSMDISSDLSKRVVARQLRKSVLDYMNSTDFRPKATVSFRQIGDLFTRTVGKVDSYTKDSPDELKPKKK